MKNSKFIKFSILGLLPVIMSIGVISAKSETPKETNAYSAYTESKSSLPSDIDLNDASESEIRNYYSALNGKNLNGTNLLKALKPILSNGQKYFSYDNQTNKNAIWRAYEIVDRDWTLSPASEISGYNPSTNSIEGYTYKASTDFNSKDNPYLHSLYVDRTMDNPIKAWGNHNQTTGGINQEHIWPKSHGFDTESATNGGGARGDLMHLWSADGYTNKIHSNYSYGNVDKTKSYDTLTDVIYYSTGNLLGTSKTLGTGTVFEPQKSDKGDIARALFYMAARYNNYANESSGIDANDPYLVLKDVTSPAMQQGSTCTGTEPGEYGILTDLLEWNRIDPVDEFEIHRNNILFNTYTKNRNPFIDFPEWAELIWGNNQTGVASPLTDDINGSEESQQEEEEDTASFVKATSISVGDKVAIVSEAVKMELSSITSTTVPYGLGEKYNTSIKGTLTFDVVAGNATSTFAFKNNNKYLSLFGEDKNSLSLSSSLDDSSSWTVTFDEDDNVKLTPASDSTRALIWNNNSTGQRFACYTGYDTKIAGSYKTIQLYKKDMSIAVTGVELDATSASVEVGKSIELTATVKPSNASNTDVIWSSSDPSVASVEDGKIKGLSAGTTTVSAKTVDGSFVATCLITVIQPPVVQSISIGGDFKNCYEINEEYSEDGLIITAHMDNGEDVDITSDSKTTITTIDTSVPGEKTITASYGEFTATAKVFVYSSVFSLDSSLGLANQAKLTRLENNGVTINFIKDEGTQAAYYTTGDAVRVYNRTSFQITSDREITNIIFGFGAGDGTNTITSSVGTFDGTVWRGSSKDVTFSIGGTTGHRKINKVCFVFKPDSHIESISATGLTKTNYFIGDAFDPTGLTVTAFFDDQTALSLSSGDYEITGFDSSTVGDKQLTISYTDSYGTTKSTTVSYKVSRNQVSTIALSGTYKTEYQYGEELDPTGLVVSAAYIDGSTKVVTEDAQISGYDKNKVGVQEILVSYTEDGVTKDAVFNVEVFDFLVEINISGNKKTEYKYDDEFSKENIVVTATMASGATKDVTDHVIFTGFDGTTLGSQVITASYTEGEITKTKTYNVNVSDYLTGISLSGSFKTAYSYGESLSKEGLVVTANYASGATKVVTNDATVTGYNSNQKGEQEITVSYTEGGVTKTAKYTVTVGVVLKAISITGSYKTSYEYGQEFSNDGIIITALYSDNSTSVVTDDCVFSGYSKNKLGEQEITVSYTEGGVSKTATITVKVIDKLLSIELSGNYKTDYQYGETFSKEGLTVTAHMLSGDVDVTDDATFTTFNPTKLGKQTITASYVYEGTEKTDSFDVTVFDVLESITVTNTNKTEFKYGDSFDKGNSVVTAHYASGATKDVTNDAQFSGFNGSALGNQTITVSYSENGVNTNAAYSAEVKDYVKELVVTCYYAEYETGSEFEPDVDLLIKLDYAGPTQDKVISASECTISSVDTSVPGTQHVTITYQGYTATIDIVVVAGSVSSFGGCMGSIVASTGIITLLSLTGACLSLLKKKEN